MYLLAVVLALSGTFAVPTRRADPPAVIAGAGQVAKRREVQRRGQTHVAVPPGAPAPARRVGEQHVASAFRVHSLFQRPPPPTSLR
jgi:hypothetical protein